MSDTAIILLAAGGSRRMGRPKQLLPYDGKPLVRVVLERLCACQPLATVVVLGAHATDIAAACGDLPASLIHNLNWRKGIAGSIHCGLEFVEAMYPSAGRVLIALADQAYVGVEQYWRLMEVAEAHPDVAVAARFAGGTAGAPAVFPSDCFLELYRLRGDRGAAGLLRDLQADGRLRMIDMPQAEWDWDTEEDVGSR